MYDKWMLVLKIRPSPSINNQIAGGGGGGGGGRGADLLWQRETIYGTMDGPRGTVQCATDGTGGPSAVAMDGPGGPIIVGTIRCVTIPVMPIVK